MHLNSNGPLTFEIDLPRSAAAKVIRVNRNLSGNPVHPEGDVDEQASDVKTAFVA
jgi:hypothetical protein